MISESISIAAALVHHPVSSSEPATVPGYGALGLMIHLWASSRIGVSGFSEMSWPSVWERSRLSAQHGKIGGGITPNHDSRNATTVNESNARILDALHNVLVGQNVTVGSHNDTRPRATASPRGLACPAHIYADDRGANMLDSTDDCL